MEHTKSDYQDIINIKWPQQKENRIRMNVKERAKIFLSFSALKGYEEALNEKNIAHLSTVLADKIDSKFVDTRLVTNKTSDE